MVGVPGDNLKGIKVLYVDGSIGFGGAAKSLSLTSKGLPDVTKFIVTSQENKIIAKWYKDFTVFKFRRLMNYRNKAAVREWLEGIVPAGLVRKLLLKMLAVCDVMGSFLSLIKILWISIYHKVDIIHMNTGWEPVEPIVAAWLLRRPCIVHLRGFFQWKERSVHHTAKLVSRVIAVSNAVGRSIPTGLLNPGRITTIYDPTDIAVFETVAHRRDDIRYHWGIKENDIAVGIFGRVIPWKGQLEFVRAALSAIEKNSNIKALIVGDRSDGTPEYFQKVRHEINTSRFRDHFICTGYQEDVESLYIACDIIVHASIEPEPFGMTIPEGMAAQKAVIAAKAGGPCEIVNSPVDGILVNPGDIRAMTAALLDLSSDKNKRELMGKSGFNKVRERFTIESICSQLAHVYEEVLSAGKSKT